MRKYLSSIILFVSITVIGCNKKISQVKADKLQKGYYRDSGQFFEFYKNLDYHKQLAFDRCLVIGSGRSPLMMDVIQKEDVSLSES